MAQFRGTLTGARGSASRLGHKGSGLTVTARGWDSGVQVEASHEDGRDVFRVYQDGGSHSPRAGALLATVRGPRAGGSVVETTHEGGSE